MPNTVLEWMMVELSNELQVAYIETAKVLKGADRRQFIARIVNALGRGGQSYVMRKLGWGYESIKKVSRN